MNVSVSAGRSTQQTGDGHLSLRAVNGCFKRCYHVRFPGDCIFPANKVTFLARYMQNIVNCSMKQCT